ncbi:hypothetical protein G9A89_009040 [Geosiphon pyriformis]|nr:hypothetical protein G9A89_009040 [Geosiphon pyriformis]
MAQLKPPKFALIAATTEKWGIGLKGDLPWKIKRDMRYFENVTQNVITDEKEFSKENVGENKIEKINAVIMGRRTWESIPKKYQPLKNRLNVVLSRSWKGDEGPDNSPRTSYLLFNSFSTAVESLTANPKVSRIYIIGGSYIYAEAIKSPLCTHILLTRIYKDFEIDTFFPEIDENVYEKSTHEELLNFIKMDVPKGRQVENETEFEFLMFKRKSIWFNINHSFLLFLEAIHHYFAETLSQNWRILDVLKYVYEHVEIHPENIEEIFKFIKSDLRSFVESPNMLPRAKNKATTLLVNFDKSLTRPEIQNWVKTLHAKQEFVSEMQLYYEKLRTEIMIDKFIIAPDTRLTRSVLAENEPSKQKGNITLDKNESEDEMTENEMETK